MSSMDGVGLVEFAPLSAKPAEYRLHHQYLDDQILPMGVNWHTHCNSSDAVDLIFPRNYHHWIVLEVQLQHLQKQSQLSKRPKLAFSEEGYLGLEVVVWELVPNVERECQGNQTSRHNIR